MATVLAPNAADHARAEIERFIAASQDKSLLRFITCGSVDDGKSTLIGRLLYDSKLLFEDQLAALASDSKKSGTQGGELDLALLVDGLAAEREQGITIDVAYRFFTTETRKFIVADTPGHEQYTRNMVTGASTADLAVILIDARKGVLRQTRRHSTLVHLLGIRHMVLAVNKMDLVGNDQAVFDSIVADYRAFADELGIAGFTAIPLSGLTGDNVSTRTSAIAWYDGPSLLEHLERVPVAVREAEAAPFRMAVQWVNRPHQNFRGYAGTIASGRVSVGDAIAVQPAGRRSTVASIVTFDGNLDTAIAGQSVTLTFADEVDCSRGDIITAAEVALDTGSHIAATLVWMADEALVPRRSYWLKLGAQTVSASVRGVDQVIDVNTMERGSAATLMLNDIGQVAIDLDRAVAAVPYVGNRRLGGFILIDKLSHATVAAGMIARVEGGSAHVSGEGERGSIRWISGAGREAYARDADEQARALGRASFVLDEAALERFLGELDATGDRLHAARELALLLRGAGVQVLVTLDVPEAEAQPGRRIVAGEGNDDTSDQWVI